MAAANPAPGPASPPEVVWLPFIKDIYPNLLTETYFVPPLHFRPVPRSVQSFAGETIAVLEQPPPQRIRQRRHNPIPSPQVAGTVFTSNPSGLQPLRLQDSDLQDDEAQNRVLQCLRELSESSQQIMMVISQLQFRKYLNNRSNPIDAAVTAMLPNLASLPPKLVDGECDILGILRHFGFLIGEIKSVGGSDYFKSSPEPQQNQMIVNKVSEAIGQLNNQGTVLNQIVSDLPPLKVTKVLVLPNITSSQLERALNTNSAVAQALCQCLQNAQDLSEAVSRCLCKDQMLEVSDNTPSQAKMTPSRGQSWSGASLLSSNTAVNFKVISPLSAWWQHVVLNAGLDPNMSDRLYEQLVARFCGPATTVDIPTLTPPRKVVRSLGQAVAETGLMISSLALYPEQVDIINDKNLDSVFLAGPPGTGKTVLIVLKGMELLQQNEDVQLLSICAEGLPVTILVERQLNVSIGAAPAAGTVRRHHFDFEQAGEATAAVKELCRLSSPGKTLHVFIDEVGDKVRVQFRKFCEELEASVPTNLSVWAAGLWIPDPLPVGMLKRELTVPLRCPPAVTDVVKSSDCISRSLISGYGSRTLPPATDGPRVVMLSHRKQMFNLHLPFPLPGHNGSRPENCTKCGDLIAGVLKHGLCVGQNELQWKDILILCEDPSPRSAAVLALNSSNIPVSVVDRHTPLIAVQNMALAQSDTVTVTHRDCVLGLERRVVIGMGRRSWQQGLGFRIQQNMALAGLMLVMVIWMVMGLELQPEVWLGMGLVFGLVLGLKLWLKLWLWLGLVVGLRLGLGLGLEFWFWVLLVLGLMLGLWLGFAVGLGLVLGLGIGVGLGLGLALKLVLGLMGLHMLQLEKELVLSMALLTRILLLLLLVLLLEPKKTLPKLNWLPERIRLSLQKYGEGGERDRLLSASRCTAQLVLFDNDADPDL